MRIKKLIVRAVALVMILLPLSVSAQRSSLNTYSPYTLYGIGDISSVATSNLRAMGGTGVAFRNHHLAPFDVFMNSLNPASYSSMPRRAFLFNVEADINGYYLKNDKTKTSYNGANIRNISVMFPIANKLGFGMSISPYSSVGYKIEEKINDPETLAQIGELTKRYEGDGDINQLKFGFGYELFKNFSIGAEMHYYFGYIDRMYEFEIESMVEQEAYFRTYRSKNMDYSKISFGAGFQYNIISNSDKMLTLGGTYRMGCKLNPRTKDYVSSGSWSTDTTYFNRSVGDISLADEYAVGLFFHKKKLSVGADYSFANWGSKNRGKGSYSDGMRYRNTNRVSAGLQYTPDRVDVRRYFNRVSYRIGILYDEYYMSFKEKRMSDKAITFGLGMPIKMGSPTQFNIGVEIGQKGTRSAGLVKANYFKISLGFSLFGEDYWFMKQKYD